MIDIRDLSKAYGDKTVFSHFSLSVAKGEHVGIMGSSGRGKTSLLRLIAGLEKPDSGTIQLPESCRFSMVFQEDRLMENMSALGNIKLVCSLPNSTIISELKKLSITEPNTPISTFSGGMKRRVSLCRALLAPADIWLLDEPYKGLDDETKRQVIEETERLLKDRTAIIVTHDSNETPGWRIIRLE